MKAIKKLPEAELEIMLVVWDAQGPVTSDYIMERLEKDWTKPTLLNLLTRLCGRGFLRCDKEGRHNVYSVLIPATNITYALQQFPDQSGGFAVRWSKGIQGRFRRIEAVY